MMEQDAEETTKLMDIDDEDEDQHSSEEGSEEKEQNSFRRGFDVVSETLHLDVNLLDRTIMGKAILRIKRHHPFVKILRLHFRQAEILDVNVNDVPARYERLDFLQHIDCGDRRDAPMFYANYRTAIVAANRGELYVYLSDDDEREILDLTVKYELRDPKVGLRFSSATTDKDDVHMYTCDAPIVAGAVACGGAGCRSWFPCVDDAKAKCPYTVNVTVQRGITVLCSGHLLERKDVSTRKTRFTYVTKHSISAHMLGLAVGNFMMSTSSNENSQIRSYATATMTTSSILRKCTADCDKMLNWIETYLQSKYPYSSGNDNKEIVYHKQVFVHGLEIPDTETVTPPHVLPPGGMFSGMKSFCTLVLLPASLLHDPERQLDICDHTNLTQTYGLARQWFGCLVRAKSFPDSWILESLSGHIVNYYVKSMKGGRTYMSRMDTINEMIIHCTLVSGRKGRSELSDLLSSTVRQESSSSRRKEVRRSMNATTMCTPLHPASIAVLSLCPNRTDDAGTRGEGLGTGDATRSLRAVMTAHMLEQRILGKYFRSGIINIVSVFTQANQSGSLSEPALMETSTFVQIIAQQSTRNEVFEELRGSFAHQWIYDAGCADLVVGYWYNKKENIAEIFLEQKGTRRYRGNIMIRVVEENNNVENHTRMISEKRHHWKLRVKTTVKIGKPGRRKKNGEQSQQRNDTPVRWIEIDPNITWTRRITVRQPDYMLLEQSECARNMTSRIEAVRGLSELPLPGQPNNRLALNRLQSVLEDDKESIFVRLAAVEALRKWQNLHAPATTTSMSGSWPGLSHLMHFKSHAKWIDAYDAVRPNDFRDMNNYILKLFVPIAVSRVRAQDGCSPDEALHFIVEFLQNNDNTSNPFSDDEYVASLIRALSLAYCANKTRLSRIGLEDETKDVAILELRRVLGFYMNIRRSHNRVVEIACVKALSRLQKARLSSWDDLTALAAPYDMRGEPNDVLLRQTALACSIELYLDTRNPNQGWRLAFRWFASLLNDEKNTLEASIEAHMWSALLRMIRRSFIHEKSVNALHDVCSDTHETLRIFWNLMTQTESSSSSSFHPVRRVCAYTLYRLIFDKGTPPCYFVSRRGDHTQLSDDLISMSRDCDVLVDEANKRIDVNRIRRLQWLAKAEKERPPEIYVPRLKIIRLLDGTYRMARVSEQMIERRKEIEKKREEKEKRREVLKLKKLVKKGGLKLKFKYNSGGSGGT